MPNNYFQFKQFTVQQDKCAMKVCTDACLFGSLAPALPSKQWRVLDIGTGTGLLALMYAQKHPEATIDAIEIDGAAAQQAMENFTASPWHEKLMVYNTSIQQFAASNQQQYDCILSNPPFFENDLRSENTKRNIALHSSELSLEELIISIDRLLKDDGIFGVLLPFHRTVYFEMLAAEKSFHLSKKILVKQTPRHPYFRSILFFGRKENAAIEEGMIIKNEANEYTPEFVELLRDYYLYL
jgi:tRNA1Val (adenine37-N6)-methyltransferase